MLKIRLTRIGKKHQPLYRIVLAEHARPVKGKFIEILGVYDPRGKQGEPKLNQERITHWIKQGAQVSPRVADILQKAGVVKGDETTVKQALAELAQKRSAKKKPKKEAEKSEEGSQEEDKSAEDKAEEKSEPTEEKKEEPAKEKSAEKKEEPKTEEKPAEKKPEAKDKKESSSEEEPPKEDDKKEDKSK